MPPPARVACVCGREGGVCVRAPFSRSRSTARQGGEEGGGRAGAALRAWRVWRRRAATPAAVKEENERAGERAGPKNGGGGGFTAFKEKRKRGERTSDG